MKVVTIHRHPATLISRPVLIARAHNKDLKRIVVHQPAGFSESQALAQMHEWAKRVGFTFVVHTGWPLAMRPKDGEL